MTAAEMIRSADYWYADPQFSALVACVFAPNEDEEIGWVPDTPANRRNKTIVD